MARIRTIKPEFPHSESMGRISRDARLLFIMLWTLVDDAGITRGNSRMLASLLFPYDDDAPTAISTWLEELEREECIVRYAADGQSYLQIRNWLNHQKIDKPTPSKLPAFDSSREDSRSLPVGEEGKGKERKGSSTTQPPAREAFRMHPGWKPSAHFPDLAKQSGLALADAKLAEFIAHWLTESHQRTQAEWDKALLQSIKHDKLHAESGGKPKGKPDNFAAKDYGEGVRAL